MKKKMSKKVSKEKALDLALEAIEKKFSGKKTKHAIEEVGSEISDKDILHKVVMEFHDKARSLGFNDIVVILDNGERIIDACGGNTPKLVGMCEIVSASIKQGQIKLMDGGR